MSRVQIYIDGGNFYHLALKRIKCHESDFDFDGFVKLLIGERELVNPGKRYYIGSVREKKDNHETTKAMSNQTKLFRNLQRIGWTIKTSKLRTRIEKIKVDDRMNNHKQLLDLGITEISFERSREKGIDVKLAADLIIGAMDDRYDVAIVVSSDSDLTPAFDIVRKRFNKLIEYVSFSALPNSSPKAVEDLKPTTVMIYRSDIQRIIPVDDLKKFIKQEN